MKEKKPITRLPIEMSSWEPLFINLHEFTEDYLIEKNQPMEIQKSDEEEGGAPVKILTP